MKYKLLSLLLIPVAVIALHKPTVETKISTSPVVEAQQETQPTTESQELAVPQVPTIEPVSIAPSTEQTPESNSIPEPEPQVAPQTTPEESLATHYTATSYGDAGQQEQAERQAR